MFARNLLVATLAGAAAALPNSLEARFKREDITADYEDAKALPAVPLLSTLSGHKHLDYHGFEVASLGVEGAVITGILPHSGANVLATGFQTQLLNGDAKITRGEGVEYFTLKEFYFGCVLDTAATVASTPLGCTVTVEGFDAGESLGTAEFKFKPEGLQAPMMKAELGQKFYAAQELRFTTKGDGGELTGTLYDDLFYEVEYDVSKKA